jgi:hypothetical protein
MTTSRGTPWRGLRNGVDFADAPVPEQTAATVEIDGAGPKEDAT